MELSFEGTLFAWQEERPDSWALVALPPDLSRQVDDLVSSPPRGFGSVRVEVTVGSSTWRTSLFPSKPLDTYVLPVKKGVRRAEELDAGESAAFTIRVLD
jgi:Domain of unknown function (DUF1905)